MSALHPFDLRPRRLRRPFGLKDHYGWNATHFINYVTDMYETFQKPVWVTEWACQDFSTTNQRTCSAEEVSDYLNTTQSWLDSNPWVERYAWFGAMIDTRNVNPVR